MLSPKTMKLLRKAQFKLNFEMRAVAAYYTSKPDIHPDPRATNTYFIPKDSNPQQSGILQYVRLSGGKQTLAVFRVTDQWRLRRLKRWPRSIDDGTAVSRTMIEQSFSDFDDELDELLNELDELMPSSQNSSESTRYGFAQ